MSSCNYLMFRREKEEEEIQQMSEVEEEKIDSNVNWALDVCWHEVENSLLIKQANDT